MADLYASDGFRHGSTIHGGVCWIGETGAGASLLIWLVYSTSYCMKYSSEKDEMNRLEFALYEILFDWLKH